MRSCVTNSEGVWRSSDVTDRSAIDTNFPFGILLFSSGLIPF